MSFLVESRLKGEVFAVEEDGKKYTTYEEAYAASEAQLRHGREVLIVREEWCGLNRTLRYAGGHRVP